MPLISVIMPSYNHERYISEAIESVLNQTFADFELIIIDDASKDDSKQIIESFRKKDVRIKAIFHERNMGIERTVNDGIKRTKGKFIALTASDDVWLPEKLEEQLKVFQKDPQVGLVYSDAYIIHEGKDNEVNKFSDTCTFYRGDIYKELLCAYSNFIPGLTVIVKKECFDRVGLYDSETHGIGDYDMWLRISKEYKVDFVDKPLAKYRKHFSNISLDYINLAKGVKVAIDKAFKEDVNGSLSGVKNKVYSNCYLMFATAFFNRGDFKECRKNFKKAIKIYLKNSFRLNTLILFFLSFLSPKVVRKIRELKCFIIR